MNHQQQLNDTDSRVQRTRRALFDAFSGLVLEQPYDDISIAEIIQQAGIARSTFYQHFKNKDDILADSMSPMLDVLAATATGGGDEKALRFVLEHFWDNRNLGRIILNGQPLKPIARALADLIEKRRPAAKAAKLWAIQSAEGQLGLIRAWLTSVVSCSVDDLTGQLMEAGASRPVKGLE